MKQYKLKQIYPGLPNNWDTEVIVGQGDRGSYGNYTPCQGKYTTYHLTPSIIENNPNFWKEIIPKAYTILEIGGYGGLYTLRKNGMYSYHILKDMEGTYTAEHLLNDSKHPYHIKSVKRESDGTIFSIGDWFSYTKDGRVYQIESIIIDSKMGLALNFNESDYTARENFAFRSGFKREAPIEKKVFLTTEDGVDKYIGEKVYCAINGNKGWYLSEGDGTIADNWIRPVDHIKDFHSKEKALEWVENNTKIELSIADIERMVGYYPSNIISILKEKVKEKLGNKQ